MRWVFALVSGGLLVSFPPSLLDNRPLRELLKRKVRFDRIEAAVASGCLDALAITAAGYTSAHSITFFQGHRDLKNWSRARREGHRTEITVDHLMASVAAPFIFPPAKIDHEYFGDGAMRQTAPLSAAIHLGAERLLLIGTRHEDISVPEAVEDPLRPTFGDIAGYMLDNLFMDGVYADLERLTRLNLIMEEVRDGALTGPGSILKRIECLVMVPSRDIRGIARKHAHTLPRAVRLLLKGLGASDKGGSRLVSFLLFEQSFTRELIRLGYEDQSAPRLNLIMEEVRDGALTGPGSILKRIECLVMVPSRDIRGIARKHAHTLPRAVRLLLKGLGASDKGGSRLVSFLLFEQSFTRELIRLGYEDAMVRRSHLVPFLAGEPMDLLDAPPEIRLDLSGEIKGPQA